MVYSTVRQIIGVIPNGSEVYCWLGCMGVGNTLEGDLYNQSLEMSSRDPNRDARWLNYLSAQGRPLHGSLRSCWRLREPYMQMFFTLIFSVSGLHQCLYISQLGQTLCRSDSVFLTCQPIKDDSLNLNPVYYPKVCKQLCAWRVFLLFRHDIQGQHQLCQ